MFSKPTATIFFVCLFGLLAHAQPESAAFLSHPLSLQVALFMAWTVIGLGMLSSGYSLCYSLGAYAGCEGTERKRTILPALMPLAPGAYAFGIGLLMWENQAQAPWEVVVSGLLCGISAWSALGQAKVAASCIRAVHHQHMGALQAGVLTALPGLLALLGFALALLILS